MNTSSVNDFQGSNQDTLSLKLDSIIISYSLKIVNVPKIYKNVFKSRTIYIL